MTDTPTPDRLARLPRWAQDYVAWLRSRVAELEREYRHASDEATELMRKVERMDEEARGLRFQILMDNDKDND